MDLVILVLLLAGLVVLIDLGSRLRILERRIAWLEQGEIESAEIAGPAAPHVAVSPAAPPPEPAAQQAPAPAPEAAAIAPAVAQPPQPVEDEASSEPGRGFGFEELFGRRLPIWAGGITLAIAGLLIVKYSVDLGLLSPLIRVVNGLLFGLALIGGAELIRRRPDWTRDPRVPQALAGAGIASLYGSILVAANVYDLIGPIPALVGMAAVTALAMALALRFGAPSALLGLVGGLAAPALVGSGEPNIPLLSLYLAFAVGGLCALSRSQRWAWLAAGALLGGFGWGGLLLLAGNLDAAASLSIGAYVMLLGILLPTLAFGGEHGPKLRAAGSLVAAAQMAALVATGGFGLLEWGLFVSISVAIVWLSRRERGLALLPPVGVAIALLLLAVWPEPPLGTFAVAAGAIGLVYGVPAMARLWHPEGTIAKAGQIGALALGIFLAAIFHFYAWTAAQDRLFALLALGIAIAPAGAAMLGLGRTRRGEDGRFALLATSAAVLIAAAALLALPPDFAGPAVGAVAAAVLVLCLATGDRRVERSAWGFAAAMLLFLLFQYTTLGELGRAFGSDEPVPAGAASLRWALCGLVAALFAWRAAWRPGRGTAQAIAVLLLYCASAQLIAAIFLPLVPAIALVALAASGRGRAAARLLPAAATAFALILAWAAAPVVHWSAAALSSLSGQPLLVQSLPSAKVAALRLLAPAAALALGAGLARRSRGARVALVGGVAAAILAAIGVHILYKQLFAISGSADFVAFGLAERTLWEALLLAGAAGAWQLAARHAALLRVAAVLAGAALAHFLLYTLLLHDPLWSRQAVGPLPILNLLPLAYAIALAALALLQRLVPDASSDRDSLFAAARMALVLLLAYSLLRQAFRGSMLVGGGVSEAEDILRSILAVLSAVAFLLWGIVRRSQAWRVGSLILMIAAVAKVFLLDASGLEGLARILSFVALGFSLIGIGWLYSRFLGRGFNPPARTAPSRPAS